MLKIKIVLIIVILLILYVLILTMLIDYLIDLRVTETIKLNKLQELMELNKNFIETYQPVKNYNYTESLVAFVHNWVTKHIKLNVMKFYQTNNVTNYAAPE